MVETRKGTRTRPAVFHDLTPDGRFTICGRPAFAHGHKLAEEDAVKWYQAQRCRTCKGENQRFGPDDSVRGRVA